MNLEKAAAALEASDDYRVLRRLDRVVPTPGTATHKGIYVDVETTGLDTERCEVIELCMWPFFFVAETGIITDFEESLHNYNEPAQPISPEIEKLTGVTNETVKGCILDRKAIGKVLESADIVIAHNAAFDRPIMERAVSRSLEGMNWGCSMSQVPWPGGRRLEYVLAGLGRFYKAHNATSDCMAGLYALQADVGGKTGLAHVLEASRKTTWHVWAVGAAFSTKDILKERGYFWDAEKKLWHKEIEDETVEHAWLAEKVYKKLVVPAKFDRVTAYNRFSKRG